MIKKSLIPYRMGELSYVYFYPFSGTGYYQQKRAPTGVLLSFFGHKRLPTKKSPHWSLLCAFKLSKIESTIEHLPSRARQKSMRSYHNGVPRHHPTENSLAASPHWVAFVQSTLQCVFLGSHQYQKCPLPPIISHLQ